MENQKVPLSVNGSNFALNLCEKLHKFTTDGRFSDICLKTSDDVKFHVHKNIISASSEYFMAMFESNMQESSANEIQLNNITGDDFRLIITFLYTGQIKLENDKVEQILRTANFFQIPELVNQCYYFMGGLLDTKNWLNIALFAHQHEFADLFATLIEFANKNSEAIFNKQEFLSLDEDFIYAIVSHKDLNVNSEEELFLSLVRWMEYDRQNREKKAFKLFTAIRYRRLTVEFIKKEKSKLPDEIEYIKMICSWLEWHTSADQHTLGEIGLFDPIEKIAGPILFGNQKIQIYKPNLKRWTVGIYPILPKNHVGQVIAFSNYLIFSSSWGYLHMFDLRTGKLTDLPQVRNRNPYAIAILKKQLYLISSYGSRKFNFFSAKWSDVSSPVGGNGNLQVAVSNGLLYAVGTEMVMQNYNFLTDEWINESPMKDIERDCSLFKVILGDWYKIYSQSPWGFLNVIEEFSKRSLRFVETGTTKFAMLTLQCVSWNDELIIYGRTQDQKNIVQQSRYRHMNRLETLPVLVDEDDSYTLVAV